jgi:spore germination protein GerM
VRRRLGALAALAALAFAAAGCAIPTQSSPSSIAPSKVPFGLLDKNPPTTTTTQPKSFVSVKVYFLNATNALEPATRFVSPPAPLISVLTALTAGPSSAEAASGLSTAIPSDVSVLSVSPEQGNVVTVNMNTAFGEIVGSYIELAVAQIVSTVANENGPGTGVLFEIDSQRISVPIANGSLVSGPVYLLDFAGS